MKKIHLLITALMLLSSSLFPMSGKLAHDDADHQVMKAFQLRMSGKVDQAKSLLDSIVAHDSTNAMAWYELARLNHYMLTGGGKVTVDLIGFCIDKAVKLEPKNVTYAYYKALSGFLNAFMAMQTQQQEMIKPRIQQTCKDFERVLALKPDYFEAMLYLVDIFGMLPVDMGGDSLRGGYYAEKLTALNPYFGAKAKSDMLPDSVDRVAYWTNLLSKDSHNPDLLTETGVACLMKDDPGAAEAHFKKAMRSDPSKNWLLLDLARYSVYKVMQDKELTKSELPVARKYFNEYLDSKPEPVVPMMAYAKGWLVRVEKFLGNNERSEELQKEAIALDPYFSRVTGIPALLLFDPPDQVTHHYFSFFSPY
jgi:tetratricopeptide (TPR) repeat protein